MTLHAFTSSLPKPFPETPGLKPLRDGNPIAWYNSAAQSIRGSKMDITWTYLSDGKRSYSLLNELVIHGGLISFSLPRTTDGRSYLVESQFIRRSDAKSVVALLAISQNVGGWIAGISETIENLLPQDVKKKAYSLVPTLTHECKRAGLNQRHIYSFDHEGAIGCTLRVEFDPGLWREYTVPVQYRTRLEARLAAVLQACEEGISKFIRFEDKTPLPGYLRDSWRTKHTTGPHDIKTEKPRYKEGEDGWKTVLVPARKSTRALRTQARPKCPS
ncbi:hypothetical protein CPB86DRAFT_793182 [Serendipita vermifera]|nr:hypothetical protein CPB86DRAFT_793182 [Serendipita vermifera]